jgi:DNA-binding MarR family transcriptional regulator
MLRDTFQQQATSVVLSGRDITDAARLLTILLGRLGQPVNVALPGEPARLEKLRTDGKVETSDLPDLARKLFHERKVRQRFFSKAMFSEPAWDMLLALYIADAVGTKQTVSRLASLIYTPMTTTMRWLNYLEKERFVLRSEHPSDNRQMLITLTDAGRSAIEDYFRVILQDRISLTMDI